MALTGETFVYNTAKLYLSFGHRNILYYFHVCSYQGPDLPVRVYQALHNCLVTFMYLVILVSALV